MRKHIKLDRFIAQVKALVGNLGQVTRPSKNQVVVIEWASIPKAVLGPRMTTHPTKGGLQAVRNAIKKVT